MNGIRLMLIIVGICCFNSYVFLFVWLVVVVFFRNNHIEWKRVLNPFLM